MSSKATLRRSDDVQSKGFLIDPYQWHGKRVCWLARDLENSKYSLIFAGSDSDAVKRAGKEFGCDHEKVNISRLAGFDKYSDIGRVPLLPLLIGGFECFCQKCRKNVGLKNISGSVIGIDKVSCSLECYGGLEGEPATFIYKAMQERKDMILKTYTGVKILACYWSLPVRAPVCLIEFPGSNFPIELFYDHSRKGDVALCGEAQTQEAWTRYVSSIRQKSPSV